MSVVGIPNDKINMAAAVVAAAGALRAHGVEIGSCGGQTYREHVARSVIAAAIPYIRAEIADEIEAMSSPHAGDPFKVRADAARIARGTQETTE